MELIDKIRMTFCKHDWECIDKAEMFDWDKKEWSLSSGFLPEQDAKLVPIGYKWTYRCKKCGKFRIDKNY